jgi:hypothetical protein
MWPLPKDQSSEPQREVIVLSEQKVHGTTIQLVISRAAYDAAQTVLNEGFHGVITHIERTCRALCASPAFNTVLVLHDIPVKDEASGEVERLPGTGTTNPALGRKLMSMVDVIGFTAELQTESGRQFVAQLVDQKGRRGGDRFDVLGEFRETNLTEWFELGPAKQTNEKETKDV